VTRENGIGQDEALTLYTAALVGAPYLALQLERLGLSDPSESLQDARLFRRDLLAEVEKARKEAS
jgi:hypothetical protein